MLPACTCNRLHCADGFTEDDRHVIHQQFWEMNEQRRRDFVLGHIKQITTLRYKTPIGSSRRAFTVQYYLGGKRVCKHFFLATLGYKPQNDRIIRTVLGEVDGGSHLQVGAPEVKRGKHEPSNKFPLAYKENVIRHIESYNPVVSHYRLEHTPDRRYLPPELSVRKMHTDFVTQQSEQNEKVCSYQYYYSVFQTMNIAFSAPTQDRCTLCTEHSIQHQNEEGHTCSECECELCSKFDEHIRNAREAREALHNDISARTPEHLVVTADMQKAILMPKLPTKDYYFSRKLVLFNETFAVPGEISDRKSRCMLWHEGESGRKAYNITSSYIKYLQEDAVCNPTQNATIFADNCNAQNKNWILYSGLARFVNDESTCYHTITLKYFEPGHTYMAADSIHGSIGKAMSGRENIYDFSDFLSVILASRRNMEATVLTHSDQILFRSEAKQRVTGVSIRNLRAVQFRKGTLNMFVKEHHTDDYTEVDFLKRDIKRGLEIHGPTGLLEYNLTREQQPRGISQRKMRDLSKFCRSMPQDKKAFYHNLVVRDNAQDLDTNIDNDL